MELSSQLNKLQDEGIYNAFVTLRGYRKSMEIVNMIAAIEGIIAAEEIWLDV